MRGFDSNRSRHGWRAGAALALAALLPAASGAQSVSLTLATLEAPGFHAEDMKIALADLRGGPATISIGRITLAGREWRKLAGRCASLTLEREGVACERGELVLPGAKDARVPFGFRWRSAGGALEATIEPAQGELWRVDTRRVDGARVTRLMLQGADMGRIVPFVPALAGWQLGGRVAGEAVFEQLKGTARLRANLALREVRFADAAGTRAGEKIDGRLEVDASSEGPAWDWHIATAWEKGEAYVAPIYLASPGITLEASGRIEGSRLEVATLEVDAPSLGRLRARGRADLAARQVIAASFAADELDLARVAPALIAPVLDSMAGPKLVWSGRAALSGEVRDNALVAAQLSLADVSLGEAGGRYALEGINATLPWRADARTEARIDIGRAQWGQLPLGPIALPLELRGRTLRLAETRIPVLDGEIVLEDVSYAQEAGRTSWRAAVAVTPVSMERLSAALGWPRMSGIFSASIPGIRQDGSTIALDGALVVQVFDGFASVTDLRLIEPFGRTPRLYADVELRNLDLEMLTQTFSFGSISGRIDGDLKGLELAGARPLRFDARIESSPGRYRKRISQRAVQNISALGGAGAAAAIQRSVLRVFEEFSYGKLGMTCRLRGGVCEMGGVENAPNGYVLVKGAGVPSINVIGYNRRVDWDELLARLKRITETNTKPVIK